MRSPELFNKEGLIRSMERRQLDAIVAASPPNIKYTTGVNLYNQILIPDRLLLNLIDADGDSTLIAFARERTLIERDSWVDDVRYYAEFGESPMTILSVVLTEKGLGGGRVGIEKRYLPVAFYEELERLVPGASFVDCEDALAEVRMIKTPKEVQLLRTAVKAMDKAIWLAAELAKPGDTERAFARQIVSNLLTLVEQGVEGPDGIVACGSNLEVMHHTSSNTTMARGDIVRYGCKASFDGYWSIILRMGAVGGATPQQLSSYSQYAEVFHDNIQQLRPGVLACDAFNSCKQALEKRGLDLVSDKIGHSTGLVFRDTPILRRSDETELQANMVLAYDFFARDKDGNPHHIEDRVLITEEGPELLSGVSDTKSLTIIC